MTLLATRLAAAATVAQDEGGGARPPPPDGGGRRGPPAERPRGGPGQRYSIQQAVSDRAQLHTIAFDGLAFLTGDLGSDTFLPPGKVSDFFGFQYMRDMDASVGPQHAIPAAIAHNMLRILSAEQKAQLVALAKEQDQQIRELGL